MANDPMLLWKAKVAVLVIVLLLIDLSIGGFSSGLPNIAGWLGSRDSIELKVVSTAEGSTTSREYIEKIGYRSCRFPAAFDWDEHHHQLYSDSIYLPLKPYWREEKKALVGVDDAMKVRSVMMEDSTYRKNEPRMKRRLTFVHIGKAGGSSVECSLRIGQGSHHCDQTDSADDDELPETAISRHVNCYTHWEQNLKCFYLQGKHPFTDMEAPEWKAPEAGHRGNDYLVNLRSPLDRIASWFVYEHTENHPIVYEDRTWKCGQLVLNSCYRTFEELTTIGLSGPPPAENSVHGINLRIATNLNPRECSHWAWATVRGHIPADYHNVYNYDWYAHRMLYDIRSNQTDIYALRMEHLEEDWSKVDRMLGGDGAIPPTLNAKQNAAQNKPLIIFNHSTTLEGLSNLCRALCSEIQVYKLILLRAKNLSPEDVATSLQEVRQQCGPEGVKMCPF